MVFVDLAPRHLGGSEKATKGRGLDGESGRLGSKDLEREPAQLAVPTRIRGSSLDRAPHGVPVVGRKRMNESACLAPRTIVVVVVHIIDHLVGDNVGKAADTQVGVANHLVRVFIPARSATAANVKGRVDDGKVEGPEKAPTLALCQDEIQLLANAVQALGCARHHLARHQRIGRLGQAVANGLDELAW